jgi:hypothetical protein
MSQKFDWDAYRARCWASFEPEDWRAHARRMKEEAAMIIKNGWTQAFAEREAKIAALYMDIAVARLALARIAAGDPQPARLASIALGDITAPVAHHCVPDSAVPATFQRAMR